MTRAEIIRDYFTKCPACNGYGGERDRILDFGMGPWYPCCFCDENGYVNLFKKFNFIIWDKFYKSKIYKCYINWRCNR